MKKWLLKLFSTQANVIYEELGDSCEGFEKSLSGEKPFKLFDVMAFSISLYTFGLAGP